MSLRWTELVVDGDHAAPLVATLEPAGADALVCGLVLFLRAAEDVRDLVATGHRAETEQVLDVASGCYSGCVAVVEVFDSGPCRVAWDDGSGPDPAAAVGRRNSGVLLRQRRLRLAPARRMGHGIRVALHAALVTVQGSYHEETAGRAHASIDDLIAAAGRNLLDAVGAFEDLRILWEDEISIPPDGLESEMRLLAQTFQPYAL